MTVQEIESRHTSGAYSKRPVTIVRGEGACVWDSEGNVYIDCVGGQGTANVGHGNAAVAEAIAAQARTLISLPEMFYNDRRAALLERLVSIVPPGLNRVFLSNSGAEAVEAGLKFARIGIRRREVVAAMRGFHGRTFGALSATWEKRYRQPFEPLVPGFRHVPYNDLAALERAVTDETAAVLLEVVQGEGGVRPGTDEYLHGAERLCRERGALFVVDEVQTGFGRTGKMFAIEHYGLQPDILCLAKSIAGGMPMGATLIGERVGDLPPHSHGSTFGGNPLACAASLAAIDFIQQQDLPGRAAENGRYLIGRLKRIESPLIREVRGLGLLVGVELKRKVTPVLQGLLARRVLALPAGQTVLRFLPPLVIMKEQIDQVVAAVEVVLSDYEHDRLVAGAAED